ncbi:TadE/TadG family type IV pilus assembly protein [Mobilibacterium timonense]|uniref:TadE/TadG family type IV pilus assembly protein n=1 Tax=Mobilibacterium timonense TaxID=1871012 RepID=UPI000986335C|nr:pilus assembly protein [Mobilibacterium timonense]
MKRVHMKERILKNISGSYLVEGAICLPLFIIGIVTFLSVILMYAAVENANYVGADEMRRAMAEAGVFPSHITASRRIKNRMMEYSHLVESASIRDLRFRTEYMGIDEAIAISADMELRASNPMNFMSSARYRMSVMSRAYVGRKRPLKPATDGDMQDKNAAGVYVFPKRGEKYHRDGCTFMKAGTVTRSLDPYVRKQYKGCPVCRSGRAKDGTTVYIFPKYGEGYHLKSCGVLNRRYMEMEKETALERGYTPCSKCGG